MSFVMRAKEKLKGEYEAYKRNKQLENDPEVVRYKLNKERAELRERVKVERERAEFEREKAELKELQRSNSTVGRFGTAVKQHLASVKASQQPSNRVKPLRAQASLGTGRNIIYDESPTRNSALTMDNQPTGSKSLILSDKKSKKKSVFL